MDVLVSVGSFVIVFASMLVEARLARLNEQTQRARGGVEPDDDVYGLMRWIYPCLFLAMFIEGAWRGGSPSGAAMAGTAVFVAAKALKWWAIRTLGPAWTFRVVVVPGAQLVHSGPYRYVRHPNYLAVLGEFAGVALLTGSWASGPLALVVFGVLMRRRIAVEERALQTL